MQAEHPTPYVFNRHSAENGDLVVYEECSDVPFSIARVFTVTCLSGAVRGQHAHKECAQLLVCQQGRCRVDWSDGMVNGTVELLRPEEGILIPPGIWAIQTYLSSPTVLMVLCNRPYEEADYIREWADYLTFRNISK